MTSHEQAPEQIAQVQQRMQAVLAAQKESFTAEGAVTAETRIDRLDRCIDLLLRYQDQIVQTLITDFGHRSAHQSKLFDVASGILPAKHCRKHLRRWMRPEKRSPMFPLGLLGAKARVEYQPKGVVGIISPWNFPVNLTFAPLANVLAAGNRAMIKPSEFTPATSALMAQMFREAFDETEIAVFTGGPEVGQAFTNLPFDHLVFTGATGIGRHVMRAAAENLVPVTLELGGKSPVIIGRSADFAQAAERIMLGKMLNAGQICLAPDYLLVPAERRDELADLLQKATARMFPQLAANPDYTSVINERHLSRLQGYVADAVNKGATVLEINPAREDMNRQEAHKMAPVLVLDPSDEMLCMQGEIFGPVLPIKTYVNLDEALAYINAHDRPLGLYYFGHDPVEERTVLDHTHSGGVSINDVLMHVGQEDLPFGGIGPSGMGAYHGLDGFREFSHRRAVFVQSRRDVAGLAGLRPPFGKKTEGAIRMQVRK